MADLHDGYGLLQRSSHYKERARLRETACVPVGFGFFWARDGWSQRIIADHSSNWNCSLDGLVISTVKVCMHHARADVVGINKVLIERGTTFSSIPKYKALPKMMRTRASCQWLMQIPPASLILYALGTACAAGFALANNDIRYSMITSSIIHSPPRKPPFSQNMSYRNILKRIEISLVSYVFIFSYKVRHEPSL